MARPGAEGRRAAHGALGDGGAGPRVRAASVPTPVRDGPSPSGDRHPGDRHPIHPGPPRTRAARPDGDLHAVAKPELVKAIRRLRITGPDSGPPQCGQLGGAQVTENKETRQRRRVSRVLSPRRFPAGATVISLGRRLPGVSSDLTRERRGPRHCSPIWSCSGWGLPSRCGHPPRW